MAKRLSTPFEAWELTDEERPVAVVFTKLQKQHLQTELASAAAKQLAVAYNPELPKPHEAYVIEQTYYKGYVEAIQFLLNLSDNMEVSIRAQLMKSVQQQRNLPQDPVLNQPQT